MPDVAISLPREFNGQNNCVSRVGARQPKQRGKKEKIKHCGFLIIRVRFRFTAWPPGEGEKPFPRRERIVSGPLRAAAG